MLFTFNKFWKTIGFLLGVWVTYALWGFEFTVITLLALLYASSFKNNNNLI